MLEYEVIGAGSHFLEKKLFKDKDTALRQYDRWVADPVIHIVTLTEREVGDWETIATWSESEGK